MNPKHAFMWLGFRQPESVPVSWTPGFGSLFVPANDEGWDE